LTTCVFLDGSARLLRAQTVANFSIDATKNVQAISPFIYGINLPVQNYNNSTYFRLGGDRWTAYNWVTNASNAGSDYNYSNDNYFNGNNPGNAIIPTVSNAYNLDAGVLVTIPINGLVAADEAGPVNINDPNRFTTRFKPEQATKGAAFTLTPSPSTPVVYEDEFVNWVKTNYPYGTTDPNRPISFELDNEPDAWSAVHPEVHPNPVTYSELLNDTINYSTAIKNVEPNALVYGAVNFGWPGFYNLNNAPDASSYSSDGYFLDTYLKHMKAASTAAGKRLLDVLDIHWYPITGGLQAPRSLWDPTYTESDYITQYYTYGPITLIPRLKAMIAADYPGTKLSISEYNYGSGNVIAGAIMEADTLGIFGAQGMYSANEWNLQTDESYIGAAFNMFRNYNGAGATFGNTSVSATTNDVADTSIYASTDTANPYHMVLVAINKTGAAITSNISLADSQPFWKAQIYQLTSAGTTPTLAGTTTLTNPSAFTDSLPANSVSTINLISFPTWVATGSGTWNTAANWSNGTIPQQAQLPIYFPNSITSPTTVTLNAAWTVGAINFTSSNSYTLAAGTGGRITLDNGTNAATITNTGGSHTISAPLTLNSPIRVSDTFSGDTIILSGQISSPHAISVAGNGTLRLGSGIGTPTFTAVIVNAGSKLDLGTNGLAINFASPAADPVATIAGYLQTGYNAGLWTGAGINSSTAASNASALAVGYADGNTDAGSAAAPNQILVKYTLAGDTNLDGLINFNDLVAVVQNFNKAGTDWAHGNFNYGTSTNFNDLVTVVQNFNAVLTPGAGTSEQLGGTAFPLASLAAVQLPEPAALGVGLFASLSLLKRRRRSEFKRN
jgi:hypothetical protein